MVVLKVTLWGLMALQGQSQPVAILESFDVFESNGKVYLRWVIIAGSTCDGIKVFRSADNLNFERIGEIPGVCGSPSTPMPYEFTDESPVTNSVNYYRLELGNNGYSETVSVELVSLNADGFQVRPNPSHGNTKIFFSNPGNAIHTLGLFNLSGTMISRQSTRTDFFDLNTAWFPAGLYLFTIVPEDQRSEITGRLLVLQ